MWVSADLAEWPPLETGGVCLLWVKGGKTRSEDMFSESPKIADIVGASTAVTA